MCRDPIITEIFYTKHFNFKRARVFAPGPDQIVMIKAGSVYLELFKATQVGNAQFAVKAWTQRGDGGTYLDGEDLVIHFYANADCYIKIYHIGVNGGMELIFPNQFQPDNLIRKNAVYAVPDASSGFVFKLGKPYGVEFIKIIASASQFTSFENSLDTLGQGSRELITRGLSVQQSKAQTAEVMLNYTILEGK
jgi:hypothetical protein